MTRRWARGEAGNGTSRKEASDSGIADTVPSACGAGGVVVRVAASTSPRASPGRVRSPLSATSLPPLSPTVPTAVAADAAVVARPASTADCWNRLRDKQRVEAELGIREFGVADVDFFDASAPDIKVACGYERVVYGDHGPYIEFRTDQIVWSSLPTVILKPVHAYYDEYHSEAGFVHLFHQKRSVDHKANPPPGGIRHNRESGYADYKVGMCYVSPSMLTVCKHASASQLAAQKVHGHGPPRWRASKSL